jgi:transcriptional regulator with XRE-family HTH domain
LSSGPLPDRQIWQVSLVASPRTKPSHKAFGQAVKAAREEKGLTQAALAKKSGLHVSYLSGVETGQRNPSLTALSQIAQALGLKLSELVERAERQ